VIPLSYSFNLIFLGLAQIIIYSLTQSQHFGTTLNIKADLPALDAPPLLYWEVLGPLPNGKLEIDGDPAFSQFSPFYNPKGMKFDSITHILSMSRDERVYSEIVEGGTVFWTAMSKSLSSPRLDIRFNVNWNEIVQGLSSTVAYEFTGWARTNSYVRANGYYQIHCTGVHTIYIKNDNLTRIIVGDVYHSNHVVGSIDLRVGLVGIVLPLRGTGQTSISCSLSLAATPFQVGEPLHVPDMIDLTPLYPNPRLSPNKNPSTFLEQPWDVKRGGGPGLLVSSLFSIVMQNPSTHSLNVDMQLILPKTMKMR
jgi:hypothetical protein